MLSKVLADLQLAYANGEKTPKEVVGEVVELLRKWPDRFDGPVCMELATLLEDVEHSVTEVENTPDAPDVDAMACATARDAVSDLPAGRW